MRFCAPPSDEAGENGCSFHRVGAAFLTVAGILVWLHLAGEGAAFIHADGRGDRIGNHGSHQFIGAVVPFDSTSLASFAVCRASIFSLLATGARGFRRRIARGRSLIMIPN
jgi:hypothetical protein